MRVSRAGLIVAAGLWLVLVGAGIKAAMDYEAAPGPETSAPLHWPARAAIEPPAHRPRLLLFAHPRCPCTRATVESLLEIGAGAPEKADIDVYFYRPAGAPPDWSRTELWRRLAAQPGITLHNDEEGREARRFGVATSGTVVLFDARSRLVFSGGITPLRGQAGDSAGRQAVLTYLRDGRIAAAETPVFGCALFESSRPPSPKGSS